MYYYLNILLFLQQIDINKKLKEAPTNNYAIGVFIGQMMPYIILVSIAYIIYYFAKKRKQ